MKWAKKQKRIGLMSCDREMLLFFFNLPMRHCTLNPIELVWTNMKTYIRDRNTKFNLAEVSKLAQEWTDNLDAREATSYANKC